MAKETILQTEGLCKEVAMCVRNAYDRGYKQGYKDGNYDKEFFCNLNFEHGTNKGLDDAWELVRKLRHPSYEDTYSDDEKRDIFGYVSSDSILTNLSASEAIKKVKEYEEKQKQDEKSCDECSWKYTADDDYDEWRKHCLKCINRCCFEPMRTDNEIKVGDEVIFPNGKKGIVWLIYGNECHTMGDYNRVRPKEYLKKTGRHFDQIAEVLKQLKGE